MKSIGLALGVTAGFAALARTQDRPRGEEACEVRVWLVDQNKNPAPLRNVSAAIVVPGKAGAPDRSTPMIIEVPLKSDPPGKDEKPFEKKSEAKKPAALIPKRASGSATATKKTGAATRKALKR